MSAASVSNPFPEEAVSTYGTAGITCSNLEYMLQVQHKLQQYLTAYPLDKERFGGAIGLRGGHGSGKTHVLGWLADYLRGARSIRGTVIYGKCDSSRFFDLCHQLMTRLERPLLIELIQLALLNLARNKVRSARLTEALAERLQSVGGLQLLQAEHNIDLEQLRQQLLAELQASTGSLELARLLLDVPDPAFGADAYRALTGGPDGAALAGAQQVRAAAGEGGSDSEVGVEARAIAALETIAALHRIAGVPLLVLVDQLEVLLRTADAASFQTVGSLTKKFVEQLGRQSALLFIAGVPEAWEMLMRDVSARFLQREQIVVGSLTLAETALFLDAYVRERAGLAPFAPATVVALHELSGGNPREILRIAHHAFNKTNGDLGSADDAVLLDSARSAGSIGDRARLALAAVDRIFPDHGRMAQELAADGQLVDRVLLTADGAVRVALLVIKATDPLDEIDSARRVESVQGYRERHWPQAELIVVSVGYSSADVHAILSETSQLISYKEKTFDAELRTRLLGLTQPATPPPAPDAEVQPELMHRLSDISTRLGELERRRSDESSRIQEHFSSQTEALAAPMIAARRLTTRREILDALDVLRDALAEGDSALERKLLHSILVANEANLHNATLEDLGELYLEVLVLQRTGGKNPYLHRERSDLLLDMRQSLRRTAGILGWLRGRRFATVMLGVTGIFMFTGGISAYRVNREPRYGGWAGPILPAPDDFISLLPFVFLCLGSALVLAYVVLALLDRLRHTRDLGRLKELRLLVENSRDASSIRQTYPQA